jgi:hypothetical protein
MKFRLNLSKDMVINAVENDGYVIIKNKNSRIYEDGTSTIIEGCASEVLEMMSEMATCINLDSYIDSCTV